MSALTFIRDYGGDEDTSEESDKEEFVNSKKLKLPTPNLSGVPVVLLEEEHVDDPTVHNGRIRSFPHMRGNWATFIYIDYPNKENLSKIIDKLQVLVSSFDETCTVFDDVHISLSKTFVLRYHMIKSFTTSLQKIVDNIESFQLNFNSVEVYCNEEKTRTFLALGVDVISQDYLFNIIKKIDNLLSDFNLPKFYEKPSFHMSIFSVNGNKKELFSKILHYLEEILIQTRDNLLEPVNINKVNCKSGNKVYQYCLK